MKRLLIPAMLITSLALTGCSNEGTSTAPPKAGTAGTNNNERRKLTVKVPTEESITQNETAEMDISIDRDNFKDAVTIELRNLPAGVTVVTDTLTIPVNQDSITVTLKASPTATVAEDHQVTVAAKSGDMPEAVANFKLDVRAKN